MKRFVILLMLFSGVRTKRILQYSEKDLTIHSVDLDGELSISDAFDPITDMKYYIFNRQLQGIRGEFKIYDEESLSATKFDPGKPVKITIHGWHGNASHPLNHLIANAFLNVSDANVIVIDWNIGASLDYISICLRSAQLAGKKIGELIDWLNVLGVPFSDFHIIGHSLGGHVAGIAGRSTARGTVDYVTGLDPVSPLWDNLSERIRPTDGKYVEIIHTSSDMPGLEEPLGHTDFYPNGGFNMPGCFSDYGCSHSRSYFYFADSIGNDKFLARKCKNLEEMKNGNCSINDGLHMGGIKVKHGYKGIYYLETNAEKPYYKC